MHFGLGSRMMFSHSWASQWWPDHLGRAFSIGIILGHTPVRPLEGTCSGSSCSLPRLLHVPCTWWGALSQTPDPPYVLDVGFGLGDRRAGSQLDSALRAPGGRLGEGAGFSPPVCLLFLPLLSRVLSFNLQFVWAQPVPAGSTHYSEVCAQVHGGPFPSLWVPVTPPVPTPLQGGGSYSALRQHSRAHVFSSTNPPY